ncbi:MAG: hypothetical protein IJT18_00130 [Oscillospiraceae bacterium]|nr:hypothetical protein [Oscillospiraceae bacterium]
MKKLTALALALLLVLSLCACGGGSSEDTSMLGTYNLYAMDFGDGNVMLTEAFFTGANYVTLKSGGAGEMALEDDVADVKWKADGEKIVISAADGDMNATVANGLLTLDMDGDKLYFVANDEAKGLIPGLASEEPTAELGGETEAAASADGAALQAAWNGWWNGCIDLTGCTGDWEFLNGSTYDAVMYVELGEDGVGRLGIFDPFGELISNEHSSIYVDAECHADEQYLYCDSGTAFDAALNPSDWRIVRNLDDPDKLNVGSTSVNANGDTIGYDFQFKPWGDRWEGDNYTQFIPHFDAYISAIDSGITSPFGDSFEGFGIAEPAAGGNDAPAPATDAPAPAADAPAADSALLGANPTKLNVNDKGVAYVSYPGDQFVYDSDYGKLKNETTGVGILIDPMLGATNLAELKASYEQNNSDEDEYSLEETTVCGYNALILKYSDWLGATMRVDLDFGGEHDGWYGISFAVSGDSLPDCDTDVVWAIIDSMELLK